MAPTIYSAATPGTSLEGRAGQREIEMAETQRASVRACAAGFTLVASLFLLAACGSSTGSSAGTPPATVAVTASPSAAAAASATLRPTPAPRPTRIPRPTDLPTDGACEEGHFCLGLLAPGTYHTDLFQPGFGFTIADGRWENLAMTPGYIGLDSIDVPGDGIYFFARPRAVKLDGSLDMSVKMTAAGIGEWMAANQNLNVGPVTDVTVGGLPGKRMDVAIAPDAVVPTGDCPVQRCLDLFNAQGSTWAWNWGVADSEMQRLYALDGKDGVFLVFVESLDGTTFESATKAADTILATVKFDQ